MKLHTPTEWNNFFGIEILDNDGWRNSESDFTKPIGLEEYISRMVKSTIHIVDSNRYQKLYFYYN
jgi:hypothetical protein